MDVGLCVANHHGFARRPRRGVDARKLLLGHREEVERIGVPQVGLGREREARKVIERPQVIRVNPCGIELGPIAGVTLIAMAKRPFQPLKLQVTQLVERGPLDRV